MIFIGLPHGASDIITMYKKWGGKRTIISSLTYFMFFICGIYLWKLYSNFFFTFLWVISTLHFWDIEKQLRKIDNIGFEDLMYFSLFTLPCLKQAEFLSYMQNINGVLFHTLFIKASIPIFIGQIIISINSLYRNIKSKYFKLYLFSYLILSIIILKLNLLFSFFSIFIFVHSLRHLKLSFARKTITRNSYLYVLLPTSVISFIIIYLSGESLRFSGNQLLFFSIGLGSLAIPHYFLEIIIRKPINSTA